jgi:precorrin-4/cobalt-precorrin-4 C11-methyltransferase
MSRVVFVGAGPGDPELITVKGRRALETADVVVYAGSLVPAELLGWAAPGAELIDSAELTLEQITGVFERAAREDLAVVRLHSGDPGLYGAIQEQIDWLIDHNIGFELSPEATPPSAPAAALGRELTLPEVSQAVIFARLSGRTPVPEGQDIDSLAKTRATLCLYLSIDKLDEATEALKRHYGDDAPAAIVYRASRPDQKIWRTTVGELAATARAAALKGTAVAIVGRALAGRSINSKLYDKGFSHGRRAGS